VIRRVHVIGVLALVLLATAPSTAPAYSRLVASAQSFRQYFQDLNQAGNNLSPLERVVFSLLMANAKPAPAHCG